MTAYVSLYDQALREFCDAARQEYVKNGDARSSAQLSEFLESRDSAPSAKDSASELQKDVSAKYSGKKFRGKVIIDETWISNIMGNISNVISVGNFLFAGSPESVGMAWFCVKLGLNAIKANYDLYGLFGSGLTTITEIMILIPHYDKLFDNRQKSHSQPSDLEDQLFRYIVGAYAAVLDFCFSVKRHVEPSKLRQVAHAVDVFGASLSKFQDKQDKVIKLKAKVLESADAVFKGRMTGDLREVQVSLDKTLHNIHSFTGVAQELAEGQAEMLKVLQDMKATLKPKTRWDMLKQDFDKIKKSLDPIHQDTTYLRKLREEREIGTTEWIFEKKALADWMSPDESSLLCLIGQAGSGKSVTIASAIDHIASTPELGLPISCYFSCVVGSAGRVDLGNDPFATVTTAIIFQVYEYALESEEKPEILEECNRLFQHPKSTQGRRGYEGPSGRLFEQGPPDFSDAILQLSRILQRSIIIIIDAVDELPDQVQQDLYDCLQFLTKQDPEGNEDRQIIKVLTGCRSNTQFSSNASNHDEVFDIEQGNAADMRTTMQSKLAGLKEWSGAEREEAVKEVMKKAGPRFDYVTEVAIPFLKQPFQRPLSNRLKALPEGITDSYKQALRDMPSNYIALLRTALTWTLHAGQPVRVKEIMEAYSRLYVVDHGQQDLSAGPIGAAGFQASALEMQQIRRSGGPFLKFWTNRAGEQIVEPVDLQQIKEFCSEPNGTTFSSQDSDSVICAVCKTDIVHTDTLTLVEKQTHLDLALYLLRHLNSSLFQTRFGLLAVQDSETTEGSAQNAQLLEKEQPAETQKTSEEEQVSGGKRSSIDAQQLAVGAPPNAEVISKEEKHLINGEDVLPPSNNIVAGQQSAGDDATREHPGMEEAPDQPNAGPSGDLSEGGKACGGDSSLNDAKDDDGGNDVVTEDKREVDTENEASEAEIEYDSDDSMEDEDSGEDVVRMSEDMKAAEVDDVGYDGSNNLRYEIELWYHHVREADRLWQAEDKTTNPQWLQLVAELDRFAIDNKSAFKEWQFVSGVFDEYFPIKEPLGPLHVAAMFGLTHWAEHLIKDRCFRPSDETGGLDVLQAAAIKADCRDMLQLLLRESRLEAQDEEELQATHSRALRAWLTHDPSAESVQIFVDHGVDFATPDETTKLIALHVFAVQATDPKALQIIMEQDETRRPNINAVNEFGETALHILLWRRNVPTDLLRAFIASGAKINVEDQWSLRPLQAACAWAEPDVVETLLEFDIDDIDDEDLDKQTALHYAAGAGSPRCVNALVQHGAKIDCKNKADRRPIHLAARAGKAETVQALLELGADANATDGHNRTPFWFACHSQSADTASSLLTALKLHYPISEINMPSKRGRTPLRLAAEHGLSNVVQELIDMTVAAGADMKAMLDMQDTKLKSTALHRVSWRGELECVKILLDNGASTTLRDHEEKTPLELASEQWEKYGGNSFEEIIVLLLGSDKEAVMTNINLSVTAAAHGSLRVLEKLFQMGADLSKSDSYGWTPLAMAQRLNKTEVERFLKRQVSWGGVLPNKWIKHAAAGDVLISDDGLEVQHTSGERCCMSTDRPLPAGLERYYFEIKSLDMPDIDYQPECAVTAIGFCTLGAASYDFPGWHSMRSAPSGKSWAYHGDDGGLFAGSSTRAIGAAERYGKGDVVGCGVDLAAQKIWFTKNGNMLAQGHTDVSGRLFPVIGLWRDPVSLQTNFGGKKPFAWAEANEQKDADEVQTTHAV